MKKNSLEVDQKNNPFINVLFGAVIAISLIHILAIIASLILLPISRLVAVSILLISLGVSAVVVTILSQRSPKLSIGTKTNFRLTSILVIAMCLIYLFLWFLAIISPDLSWDGNAYHIPPIAMWAQEKAIHWIETPYMEPLMNGYPKGGELTAFIWVIALGNSVLNTFNLLFLPLGILGIASITRSFGAKIPTALFAGLCYMLIPVNLNQMTTTYVDAAFASSAIAMIAIWLYIIQKKPNSYLLALTYGAAIGLAISIKSTGVALGGLSIVILLIFNLFDIYAGNRSPKFTPYIVREKLFLLLSIILGALLVGGYWYIRNLIYTGSPLYPVGLIAFGKVIFPGLSVSEAIHAIGNTPEKIRAFPDSLKVLFAWLQDISNWPTSIRGYDTRLAGMGYLWILGCFPAIIITGVNFLRKKSRYAATFFALAALVSIVFFMTPLNWWSRYTFWIYGFGLPSFALVFEKTFIAKAESRVKIRLTRLWLFLCVLFAAFEGFYCMVDAVALATPTSVFQSPQTIFKPDTWKWSANYLYPEMHGSLFDESINHDDVVAISSRQHLDLSIYTNLVGQLSQPIGKRRLIFISNDVTIEYLKTNGIDRIFWDKSIPLPEPLTKFPQEETLDILIISPEY